MDLSSETLLEQSNVTIRNIEYDKHFTKRSRVSGEDEDPKKEDHDKRRKLVCKKS